MTKRKNSNKETRNPKPKPLEQFLKKGDPETYGQFCWSLANRATIRHQEGDVIKLADWDKTGKQIEKRFRFTQESIENIQRCQGMRTCGETSAIFSEPTQVEPWVECHSGHQAAALEYLMYGIIPTKRCPGCGEVPTFHGLAMSPDFLSSEPPKGTDGEEYQVCPKCVDDMLELQGNNPVGWGWDIVCTSCEWQIKQVEELDIHQYPDLMEEIKLKVNAVQ